MARLSRRDPMLVAAETMIPMPALATGSYWTRSMIRPVGGLDIKDCVLCYCDANQGWLCNLT